MVNSQAPRVIVIVLAAISLVVARPQGGAGQAASAQADESAQRMAVEANTAFAVDFYRIMAQGSGDSNLFISPYSVSTILGLTSAGARGPTARQMQQVLHVTDTAGQHAGTSAVLRRLLDTEAGWRPYSLSVANSLWVSPLYALRPEFSSMAEKAYAAGAYPADFPRNADAERVRINRWVEEKTQSRITDLIPPNGVVPATALVLVNAIYFKGAWQTQFRPQGTRPDVFHVTPSKNVQMSLMQNGGTWSYLENDEVQIVSLPYTTARRAGSGPQVTSMLMILPRRGDGLTDVEKRLTPALLTEWIGGLRSRTGRVMLPKFRVTSTNKLSGPLRTMGMTDAFDRKLADFTGLVAPGSGPVWIDEVFHKAFVDVDEAGTEAAAATGGAMVAAAGGRPADPFSFRADHPFLFAIRFESTGSILFMGRITNPAP